MKRFPLHLAPFFLLPLVVQPRAAGAAEQVARERDVGGQYLVRATFSEGELHRSIFPRVWPEIATQGESGRIRKLRLPAELYSEVRTYQKASGDEAGLSYERAYTRMVETGECRPVSAGFREATFDCGLTKGRRTVAVREDSRGTYFSWESIATELIPDRSAFDRARSALDDLTTELIDTALQKPAENQ